MKRKSRYLTRRHAGPAWLGAVRRDCRGQIVWLFALLVPFFTAFLGLSLDVGRFYHVKRQMQTAADAGAMGGAHELWRGNLARVETAAKADTRFNSFNDDTPDVTVTVNNPPLSGARAGNAGFVEVIIDQPVDTFFMRYFNPGQVTIRARAVAGLVPGGDYCVVVLDPEQRGAMKVNGTVDLTATCGIMVNSSNDRALLVEGGACIYADPAGVGVTGGYVENGSANCVDPDPSVEVPAALDPLAYMAAPAVPATSLLTGGLKITGVDLSLRTNPLTASAIQAVDVLTQTITVKAGLYKGGIDISGSGFVVRFLAGIYTIDGGDLRISGTLTVIGEGVTFYIVNTSGDPALWGNVSIGGGVTAQLSAPTSGPTAGILFWNTGPGRNSGSGIAGNSESRFVGVLYFPSSALTFTGTSDGENWTMIVADTLTVSGNSTLSNNYTDSPVPMPTRKVTLVE